MASLVSGNWRRLADYVRSARVAQGFGSQLQLAQAAGVSEGSVRSLESGQAYTRMPVVIPAIESALGWPPGTARRIVTSAEVPPFEASPEEMQAAAQALLDGDLTPRQAELVKRALESQVRHEV